MKNVRHFLREDTAAKQLEVVLPEAPACRVYRELNQEGLDQHYNRRHSSKDDMSGCLPELKDQT